MILPNPLKVPVVFHYNGSWDLIEVPILSCLNYSVPILLTVPLHWSSAYLIRAFDSGVLLHAVFMSTIVHLDYLNVK